MRVCALSRESRANVRGGMQVLVLSFAALLLCLPTLAQSVTGRILGIVTDQSGGVLVGATVTITDVQRGAKRTIVTDSSGQYVAPELPPGVYTVRVEVAGFKAVERPNIQLEVAKDLSVDFSLQPGEVTQTITVTQQVPLLDTTSSALGGTLSNEQINDLPLNGRNYQNLLQLRPAVVRYPGGGFSTTSTNGLRAEDNAYVIEGLFNSEPYSGQGIINGAGIVGDSATILPIDAIQEFNLIENPPAEYGWKPGAIVNVALKSGTNSLHGTAYAFGRDDVLDARNFFNVAPNPKITTLEQFGGTLGGPIVKDKLFFFGSYEGQRYHLGNTFGVTTPITASSAPLGTDPANVIPDAIHALLGAVPAIPISLVSQKISGCTVTGSYPNEVTTCNGKGFPTNTTGSTGVSQGFPNDARTDDALGKVDYHANDRNTISGMYFFGDNSGIAEDFPELQPNWRSLIHTRAQVAGGSWVWTPSARWVNEARVGYSRLYQPTMPADLNVDPNAAYGLNTGVPFGPLTGGLPRIGFGPFFTGLGGFKWPKIQGPNTIIQFIDHVSYSHGIHAIKFGGEIHRDGVTGAGFGNARGSFKFLGGNTLGGNSTALEDFFAGFPAVASVLAGDPTFHLSNWAYALFVQDDIRLTRKLTINLGLRYELNTVIKEQNNLLGNFDPNVGLVQVGKQISSPYNGDHTNFAPRAGFAWDPWGTGKTVIRGGGGLVYEVVNWQAFMAFNNSFGLSNVPTGFQGVAPGGGTIKAGNLTQFPSTWDTGAAPVFVNIGPSSLSCAANPCAIMGVDRNLTTPFVANWTLNIQHAFTPNVSLEVAYVGNHGFNMTGIRDINQPPVGSGWATCTTVCPDPVAEQDARPFNTKFPFLSNIFQMGNIYKSSYNGLQTTLTARNFHGLNAVAGYTYSHALDDVGANWHFGYGNGLPMNSYNTGLEYANSDFDMRHRLTLSLTYAIPGRKSFAQLLEGWQLTSIVTLDSPQPWGVIDLGSDVAGTGALPFNPPANSVNRWDFFGNPNAFTSGPTPIPFFGGASNAACAAKALAMDGGAPGLATAALNLFGCYAKGGAMMLPPALGTFGTMRRNSFKDSGFRNWDFSIGKNWKFGERLNAQFRAEFFNVLNHPNFANPYGGQNGLGLNDPTAPPFGCGCVTPDVAAANPIIGSGGARAVQLGLKLSF
ncbi:MAG TPA: TonB-dependent receptor [Candidatus Acidoferrales bacterium]|nr:TonB-dependent receptor [Candidatus Acidoferrales bacterium]